LAEEWCLEARAYAQKSGKEKFQKEVAPDRAKLSPERLLLLVVGMSGVIINESTLLLLAKASIGAAFFDNFNALNPEFESKIGWMDWDMIRRVLLDCGLIQGRKLVV
jgi:hypothetical protein